MKIVHAKPPNYADIIAVFPFVAQKRGVLFCWGETIFNPDDLLVPGSIVAHETIHSRRQGPSPVAWWERYLAEKEFRFAEELVAHKAEYEFFLGAPRAERRFQIRAIARRLSGPLYGHMVTTYEAKRLICRADAD